MGRRVRRSLGVLGCLCLWPVVGCSPDAPAAGDAPAARDASRPPNVVLLISDDHGYPEHGFMGAPRVRTPEIDRLARDGVAFTHGFSTASVCRPSLASLLTGLDPLQLYVWEQQWLRSSGRGIGPRTPRDTRIDSFASTLETLPRLLSEQGYVSYQAGKHWEGSFAAAGFDAGMVEEQVEYQGGGGVKGLIRHGIAPVVEFIEHNADRPFFLWFAPMLPHLPHDAPERYEAPYADLDAQDRRYYAAIAQLDEGIGQLLARIRELGLEERTLFVYLTDNGWDSSRGEGASITLGGPKGKLSLYELGYRTPIVFTWKGHIAPQPPRSELVSSVDVYPTILDYAGASQPPQRRSHSLRPLIEGGSEWPRTDLVGWTRRVRAAEPQTTREKAGTWWRDARWHYLQPTDGRAPELYDVEADPRQTRDVADEHPDVVVRASARIDEWVRDVERREDVGPSPDTP